MSKIIGNPVGTTLPKPNWNQTDPTKGDYIKNKPFGEITVMGDTLTWDGNTEGKDYAMNLCKVSDVVIPAEVIANGGIVTTSAKSAVISTGQIGTDVIYADLSSMFGVEAYGIVDADGQPPLVVIAPNDCTVNGMTVRRGTYFFTSGYNNGYVSSLTINNYNGFETTETVPLPNKYLPEHLQFGEITTCGDTLTWDGNTEGLVVDGSGFYFKVSDLIPTLADLQNGGVAVHTDGAEFQITSETIDEYENFILLRTSRASTPFVLVALADNVVIDDKIVPKKGLYFVKVAQDHYTKSLTINGYTFETTEITTLPNKYLDIVETVGTDTLTWNGDTSGKDHAMNLCKVSDVVITAEDVANGGSIVYAGEEFEIGTSVVYMDISTMFGVEAYGFVYTSSQMPFAVVAPNDCELDGMSVKKGIYFLYDGSGTAFTSYLTINNFTGFPKEQVKQEYLPSGSGGIFIFKTSEKYDVKTQYEVTDKWDDIYNAIVNGKTVYIDLNALCDYSGYYAMRAFDWDKDINLFQVYFDDGENSTNPWWEIRFTSGDCSIELP